MGVVRFVNGLETKPMGDYFVGVDLNFATIDCTPIHEDGIRRPETISTSNIEHIQDSFSRRKRRIQLHVKNPQKRDKKLRETSGRQARRIRDAIQKLTTDSVRKHSNATFVLEDPKHIRKAGRPKGRRFRTRLNRWPYRMAQTMIDYKSPTETLYIDPRGTSSRCLVCGGKIEHPTWIPKDVRWYISVCPTCDAKYDRNRLASLAIACRGRRLCGQPFAVSADAS